MSADDKFAQGINTLTKVGVAIDALQAENERLRKALPKKLPSVGPRQPPQSGKNRSAINRAYRRGWNDCVDEFSAALEHEQP